MHRLHHLPGWCQKRESLRNISNIFDDQNDFRTIQKTPAVVAFQTPRRTASSTPSRAGRQASAGIDAAVENDALRHRVWQLERALEKEKRRNAVLQRNLDQNNQTRCIVETEECKARPPLSTSTSTSSKEMLGTVGSATRVHGHGGLHVFVKWLSGKQVEVQLDGSAVTEDLKAALQTEGIPAPFQTLICGTDTELGDQDRLSQLCKDSQGTLQLVLLISSSKSLGLVYASCHQVDEMLLWQVQMPEKHENWQLCEK
eukprot:symbB.v1.2.013776.t1/scaffold983.1/size146703/11